MEIQDELSGASKPVSRGIGGTMGGRHEGGHTNSAITHVDYRALLETYRFVMDGVSVLAHDPPTHEWPSQELLRQMVAVATTGASILHSNPEGGSDVDGGRVSCGGVSCGASGLVGGGECDELAGIDITTATENGSSSSGRGSEEESGSPSSQVQNERSEVKRCLACGATSTPEWRKGPLGRRTLCNACGLCYAKLCDRRKEEAKYVAPT